MLPYDDRVAAGNDLVRATRNTAEFHCFEGLEVRTWFTP